MKYIKGFDSLNESENKNYKSIIKKLFKNKIGIESKIKKLYEKISILNNDFGNNYIPFESGEEILYKHNKYKKLRFGKIKLDKKSMRVGSYIFYIEDVKSGKTLYGYDFEYIEFELNGDKMRVYTKDSKRYKYDELSGILIEDEYLQDMKRKQIRIKADIEIYKNDIKSLELEMRREFVMSEGKISVEYYDGRKWYEGTLTNITFDTNKSCVFWVQDKNVSYKSDVGGMALNIEIIKFKYVGSIYICDTDLNREKVFI